MRLSRIALLAAWAGWAGAQERPADQLYSAPLALDAPASHYRFTVPAATYRGAARRDLGDLRVFNAAGEPVPYAFAPREGESEPLAQHAVNLFPLHGEAGKGVDSASVQVRRSTAGTVIDIRETSARPARRAVLGYLLDASALEERKQALLLEWQAAGGFNGSAHVEGSDDLRQWSTVASGAPVLFLDHAGARLERKRVELGGTRAKYLRLSFSGVPRDFVLKEVRVEMRGRERPEPAREWIALQTTPGKERGELLFDTGGYFPVDRLRVSLPQINTVARVQLLVRERPEEKWRHAAFATVYRLRGAGGELVNPEIVLQAGTERYRMLRVDQRGGGFGAGEVGVEAGWLPHDVVFAARGEGPFLIAYGAKGAKQGALAIGAVLPGYKEGDLKLAQAARVGQPGEPPAAPSLASDPVRYLRDLAASGDGRKWLLWGALVAGVLLLAWMAFRLLGEVGKKDA